MIRLFKNHAKGEKRKGGHVRRETEGERLERLRQEKAIAADRLDIRYRLVDIDRRQKARVNY